MWLPPHVWTELTGLLYPQHVFFVSQQVNLKRPALLALAEIKSEAACWDFHVGAGARALHTGRRTHTQAAALLKALMTFLSFKLLQRKPHELCIISAPPRK